MVSRVSPLSEVLARRYWGPYRLEAEDAFADGQVSDAGIRAMDRWLAHLHAGKEVAATAATVLAFFSTSKSPGTISTLARAVHAVAPGDRYLPAISEALKLRSQAYAPKKATRARSITPTVSVEVDALPAEWLAVLADMRMGVERGCRAPAGSIVDTIEMKLRQFAFSAEKAGLPATFDIPALSAYAQAMVARGLAASTVASTLNKLETFGRYVGAPAETMAALVSERLYHAAEARLAGKEKDRFLSRTGLSINNVACAALQHYQKAHDERNPRIRHMDWLRAALFAFVICRPLRPLDIRKFVIGQTLQRDSEGWGLYSRTRKNNYKLTGRLWDVCTPYLDGAILLGADEAHLWEAYDRAHGRRLLADRDGSPLCDAWATQQFRRVFGRGVGIMRTLWHDLCATVGTEEALRAALAICGQFDPRTARHYRTVMSERTLLAQGQALIAKVDFSLGG